MVHEYEHLDVLVYVTVVALTHRVHGYGHLDAVLADVTVEAEVQGLMTMK